MGANYQEVPNILSGKDLDYLSDMFEWNYGAYKKTSNAVEQVGNEDIRKGLMKGKELFERNMQQVLSILNQGGANE